MPPAPFIPIKGIAFVVPVEIDQTILAMLGMVFEALPLKVKVVFAPLSPKFIAVPVAVKFAKTTLPEKSPSPCTDKSIEGVVVPMPALPKRSTRKKVAPEVVATSKMLSKESRVLTDKTCEAEASWISKALVRFVPVFTSSAFVTRDWLVVELVAMKSETPMMVEEAVFTISPPLRERFVPVAEVKPSEETPRMVEVEELDKIPPCKVESPTAVMSLACIVEEAEREVGVPCNQI